MLEVVCYMVSFLIKIREIFTFNISFIDVINILTVGELPTHSHTATISTNGKHNHTALGCNASAGPNNGHFGEIGNKTDGSYANTEYAGNHSHTISINNIGGNNSHNNIQPYIAVYIWKRIA